VKSLILILFCVVAIPGLLYTMDKRIRELVLTEEECTPKEELLSTDAEEAWCREQAYYHYHRMRRIERCYNIRKLYKDAKRKEKEDRKKAAKSKPPKDE